MTFKEKPITRLYAFALAAVFAIALAGCGGGGGGSAQAPTEPMPMPTPYETALEAITAADTPEAAQAAYDALKDDVSAAQGEELQAAVDARVAELATMARVDAQKMALMTAAGDIDISDLSTQEAVDAAREAIVALREALEAAEDVNDADKAMYMSQLDDAVAAVDEAQGGIDTEMRRTNQMDGLMSASGALQAALAALSGQTPTKAQLDAANTARTALNEALAGAEDLTGTEKAPYQREADNAAAPIRMAQAAFDEAMDEADMADKMAMMATAMKLHAGISGPVGTAGSPAGTDRIAGYNATDSAIEVSIGNGSDVPTPVELSEDEDTTVAAQYGWTGMRLTAEPDGDGTYEAYVYSNVGEPTEGAKFNDDANGGYALNANTGETVEVSTLAAHAANRIASPRFDHTAGIKEFELGANLERVMIPGSYRGVSGTYYCDPAASSTCAVQIATDGFVLGGTADADNAFTTGGGTWTFKPTNPEARFMDVPDAIYSSYGWWIHKSEDGSTFTASAFVDDRGAVPAATGIDTLNGTATYMGGAAGKYALRSMTGGTNDAGHFTARATLEADFTDNMVTGTIDNFTGADGQSRDWSVELKESGISAGGVIIDTDGTGTDQMQTVWSMGGTDAADDGGWTATLKDNGDDGVPKSGTGTFTATFGTDGTMVGAFGVNKQ